MTAEMTRPAEPRGRALPALVLAAALPVPAAAGALAEASGAALWKAECGFCHALDAEAEPGVGPHLAGILDRPAGAVAGFAYSEALRSQGAAGLTWTAATLDAYIADPDGFMPGTRMGYPGLGEASARADLVAWLAAGDAAGIETAPEIVLPEAVLAIEGDREWGEFLAAECSTCHQRDGSSSGIPPITNWPEPSFVKAMHAFREGIRPNPVMQGIAKRLTDEEIASLAVYFATID